MLYDKYIILYIQKYITFNNICYMPFYYFIKYDIIQLYEHIQIIKHPI